MKNLASTLFVLLFLGSTVFAQEENKADTMKVELGGKTISIIDSKSDSDSLYIDDIDFEDDDCDDPLTYWGGIDIGINQMLNANGGLGRLEGNEWLEAEPVRSLHVGFNLFEQKIKLVRNHVGLVTGLGVAYNSFGLADSVSVQQNTVAGVDSTFAAFSSDRDFSKNKMRTATLRVPVLLEFNTSDDEDRNFHISAGVYGGWRYSTINKREYEDADGGDVKERRKDDFNMTDFTLDATARIGYRGVTLFANYGLTPLFEDGKGPEVYPVTVGINVINF